MRFPAFFFDFSDFSNFQIFRNFIVENFSILIFFFRFFRWKSNSANAKLCFHPKKSFKTAFSGFFNRAGLKKWPKTTNSVTGTLLIFKFPTKIKQCLPKTLFYKSFDQQKCARNGIGTFWNETADSTEEFLKIKPIFSKKSALFFFCVFFKIFFWKFLTGFCGTPFLKIFSTNHV